MCLVLFHFIYWFILNIQCIHMFNKADNWTVNKSNANPTNVRATFYQSERKQHLQQNSRGKLLPQAFSRMSFNNNAKTIYRKLAKLQWNVLYCTIQPRFDLLSFVTCNSLEFAETGNISKNLFLSKHMWCQHRVNNTAAQVGCYSNFYA